MTLRARYREWRWRCGYCYGSSFMLPAIRSIDVARDVRGDRELLLERALDHPRSQYWRGVRCALIDGESLLRLPSA